MTVFRLLVSIVVLAGLLAAASAREKPVEVKTWTSVADASRLAVAVRFSAFVENPVPEHTYLLHYQIRVHTKTGEAGPILGDTDNPIGKSFSIERFVGDSPNAQYLRTGGEVDITRKDLSTLTNLPRDARDVILRVEPHVWDATDKKYITPAKPPAALIFVETDKDGRVYAMRAFNQWFVTQFYTEAKAKAAVKLLSEVDAWDRTGYDFTAGFERLYLSEAVAPPLKTIAVRAMPAKLLGEKNNLHELFDLMTKEGDVDLKVAVEAKRAEWRELEKQQPVKTFGDMMPR